MKHYATHLANIAWYLDDEPDQVAVPWYGITPANLIASSRTAP